MSSSFLTTRINSAAGPVAETLAGAQGLLAAHQFNRILSTERKRTERSGRPLALVLIPSPNGRGPHLELGRVDQLLGELGFPKDAGPVGWYAPGCVLGVIVSELTGEKAGCLQRIQETYRDLDFSVHYYPESAGSGALSSPDADLYPDLHAQGVARRMGLLIKRILDVAATVLLLVVLAPLLVVISIWIKATSAGPVLFRQERVGQFGKNFTFLKFRSMYTDTDESVHEAYIEKFIQNSGKEDVRQDGMYKLTRDQRVTPAGRFLRKTSLDELPQLFNVLKGEMSLVGPRPPIPYELRRYDLWHRNRILEMKPGITGLWQVKGRSRTTFDEMVRMDLKYCKHWSLLLDLVILIKTPLVVFKGDGAC